MLRPLAALALALPTAALAQETPVGGVGRLACAEVIGIENMPYLGQAGDWALGYLAGRLDAGQDPTEETALSPDAGLDAVTGIAVRCRQNPQMAVIEAVRDYAEGIFGEPAQGGPVVPSPPRLSTKGGDGSGAVVASRRPEPRPVRGE